MIPKYVLERRPEAYTLETWFKALRNRLQSYIDLWNTNEFPFQAKMAGFPDIRMQDREECLHKIHELCSLCFVDVEIKTEKTGLEKGVTKVREFMRVKEVK